MFLNPWKLSSKMFQVFWPLLHGKTLIIVYSYSLSRDSLFATLLQTNGSQILESQLLSATMQDLSELFVADYGPVSTTWVYMQKNVLAELQN